MIHSMSGGVIRDQGSFDFVKVAIDGDPVPHWYISDFDVEEGDRVSAPVGKAQTPAPATVLRVERNVSGQVTPVPLRSAKRLIAKLID